MEYFPVMRSEKNGSIAFVREQPRISITNPASSNFLDGVADGLEKALEIDALMADAEV